MGQIPWFLYLLLHYWCVEMQQISVYWFRILQLYWICVSVLSFFSWGLLGFLYRISRVCEDWRFDFFLANLNVFSFCCLIAEARNCSTIFNNNGESGHPFLVFDYRGKALSFSPLRVLLAVDLSYGLYDVEICYSNPTLLMVFIKNGCYTLSYAFYTSIERMIWFLSFF